MADNLITRRRGLLKEYGGGTPSGDLWVNLFTSINNGTYTTDYAIGDLIPLDLGTEGLINMQIVAFDADTLVDGTGTAPVTLISKELLATSHRMNPALEGTSGSYVVGTGAIRGWWQSKMRIYLQNTIMPNITPIVSDRIVSVVKTSYDFNPNGTTVQNRNTFDKVWIPSVREIYGSVSIESSGTTYSAFFPTDASKQKYSVNNPNIFLDWWLRSASSYEAYYAISQNGAQTTKNAENLAGIALGFCVG